jgi:predicted nucleotidyltransferase
MSSKDLVEKREGYSKGRISELKSKLGLICELERFPNLVIFAAGSYARLEAGKHSDIDMFFLDMDGPQNLKEPRTSQIRLFAKVINIVVDEMDFPKFSNDGQYLRILHIPDMIEKLGGQEDDYQNHFTTRMLLLLESVCLFHDELYRKAVENIIKSYFTDYPKHMNDFKPIFLMNDIMRYWKTLCLNYENKRRGPGKDTDNREYIKQRVRNFKLKFSRMTTCFATIASLSCQLGSVTEEEVNSLVQLTPRQRLQQVPNRLPESAKHVEELLESYTWFLEMTGLPTDELESHFSDEDKRRKVFEKANEYGDKMFRLLQAVDQNFQIFRYLVI